MKLPIYLDYSATTPVDPRVAQAMIPWLTEHFGNAASRSHAYGWEAEEAVEKAREHVAALVNADAREIVWTSGATEAINLALKGAAHFYKDKGKHVVTVKTEHKATLDTVRELEREGFEATYLDVDPEGMVSLAAFEAALRPDTIVASVMMVNNEIGVVQDIAGMGEICRKRGIVFHVDAAQATGKVAIDLAVFRRLMSSKPDFSDTVFRGKRAPVAALLYTLETLCIVLTILVLGHSSLAGPLTACILLTMISLTCNSTHSIIGTAAAMDLGNVRACRQRASA